jgi:hypothetical protein
MLVGWYDCETNYTVSVSSYSANVKNDTAYATGQMFACAARIFLVARNFTKICPEFWPVA